MAGVDRGAGHWLDVYRRLTADISAGVLAPGVDLPTLAELAHREGLTHHGARRVMERLRDSGRVQSWQGKGYRVVLPKIKLNVTARHPVFGDRVRDQGFTCASHLLSALTVPAPRVVSQRMRRRSGIRVVATETLREVDGRPYGLSIDHFLHERFSGIDTTIRATGSVSQALARHGMDHYLRDHTSLEARLPSAHEALVLGIPRQQPVYETVGANLDAAGDVVQVSRGIWRADCVAYEF